MIENDIMNKDERRQVMPESCRGHYRKAMRGRSMKAAITAQCLECVMWVRKEVELCTDTGCPLFPYRPFQLVPWKAFKVKAGHGFSRSTDSAVLTASRID